MSGSKTTQTNTALQPYLGAYSDLLSNARSVASTPYAPAPGPYIAGFTPQQQAGFGIVGNTAGGTGLDAALPFIGAAQTDFSNATTPLWPETMQWTPDAIRGFESPYTQDVVNATQRQFDLSNAEQFNQERGSAAASGAFGGDREAVVQSELAKQQHAAEDPVIAGLYDKGFTNAEQQFQQQQQQQLSANEANAWLNSQAAFGESSLGSEVPNLAYTGASQLNTAGGEQQALAQEGLNIPIEQYYAKQAYPFQTAGWLDTQATGLGTAAGSTSTTKTQTDPLTAILGALTGVAGATGAFGGGTPGSGGWLSNMFSSAPSSNASVAPGYANYGGSPYQLPPVLHRRGGAVSGRGRGIVVPFPMHRVRRGIGGSLPTPANVDLDVVTGAPDGMSPVPAATGFGSGPPKANAQPPKSGGGPGLMSVASTLATLRRGGIAKRAPGGSMSDNDLPMGSMVSDDPANTNMPPRAATGTDGMPFPNVDYKPAPLPDTWSKESDNALNMALIAAGADMIASGNIGHGIGSGLKTFMGIKNKANAARTHAAEYEDTGAYHQADVEEGADRLWSEAQAHLHTAKHEDAEDAAREAEVGLARERLGYEEKKPGTIRNYDDPVKGPGTIDENGVFTPGAHVEREATDPDNTATSLYDQYKSENYAFDPRQGVWLPKPGAPSYRAWLQSVHGTPAAAAATPAPVTAPTVPRGVPPGSLYSPSRKMWKDPAGRLYKSDGTPITH